MEASLLMCLRAFLMQGHANTDGQDCDESAFDSLVLAMSIWTVMCPGVNIALEEEMHYLQSNGGVS